MDTKHLLLFLPQDDQVFGFRAFFCIRYLGFLQVRPRVGPAVCSSVPFVFYFRPRCHLYPTGALGLFPGVCYCLTVRMGKSLQGKRMLPFALSRSSRVNPFLWIAMSAPGTSRRGFSHNGKQLVGDSIIRKPTPESRTVARFHQFLHQLQKSNSFFWVP